VKFYSPISNVPPCFAAREKEQGAEEHRRRPLDDATDGVGAQPQGRNTDRQTEAHDQPASPAMESPVTPAQRADKLQRHK
jgi:hypothetical protein